MIGSSAVVKDLNRFDLRTKAVFIKIIHQATIGKAVKYTATFMKMSLKLLTTVNVGGQMLKNRMVLAPMTRSR